MNLVIGSAVIFFVIYFFISYRFELYDKIYDPKKLSHKAVLCFTAAVCFMISIVVFKYLKVENLNYPYDYSLFSMNAYEQMFDAFFKHQLNIDIVPDEMLSQLQNPYDWGERNLYSFSYLWDRVYFDNTYYSYFGIAPVILIYFPFYFITGKVPAAPTVCFILSLVAITAIAFLVIKLHKIFMKELNLALLAFSILAVEAGSLILMSQSSADSYYIAVSSGITFLALFLLFTFCAYDEEKVSKKCLFFALSGISLVFLVMSRPNLALYFLIAVPVYFSVILSKDFKLSQKLRQVVSFAVPVIIGAAFVMWYNYARFGSVFEFGAKYQLTVYDVSKYAFNMALVAPAFYYYFFQNPEFTAEFPFLDIPFYRLTNINTYIYLTSTIGLLSFPSVWGVACMPASLLSKKTDKAKKSILVLALICVIVMAVFDMCFAGVNIRYLADIALIGVLLSSVMLCDFYALFSKSSKITKTAVHSLLSLMLILSFALGALMIIRNERDNLLNLTQINY